MPVIARETRLPYLEFWVIPVIDSHRSQSSKDPRQPRRGLLFHRPPTVLYMIQAVLAKIVVVSVTEVNITALGFDT